MNGRKTKKDMNEWLISFQNEVNKIAESDCLIFTAKIWDIADDKTVINNKLTVVNEKYFSYLDMEMYWNERKELNFRVHMKPKQKLKYLNSDSTHMPSIFRAIPIGVLGRLSKLTSKNNKMDKTTIDKVYRNHANVLKVAGIAPKIFLTFLELEKLRIKFTKSEKELKTKAKEKKPKERHIFLCWSK